MSWVDVFLPLGAAIASGLGGVLLGKHLKGKPPAPRSAWEQIEREAQAKREREARKS
jgi:hypothetical protein